ncbi:RCC1 and BTB domain-containing protein 1 [Cyphomyrmex costatus]|uniref:RCC1 and BTB domain-containing protein 1 n=1 Tax=Cyphomyrmex costatus TaxID=456900 RepID=A0A151IQ76_9HYME|nr:RCC1 and BTB domain-containing protein 1 [Cyphomyrmex costatus]
MSCGENFFVVVTNIGKIYTWGDNVHIQLGVPSTYLFSRIPLEVTELSGKSIVKVTCGKAHILALTNIGKVYAWGSNGYWQSEPNRRDLKLTPIEVNIPNMKKASDIATIVNCSIAKSSENGFIYLWGDLGLTMKKYVVCEYTNIFDISNAKNAQSPMSMAHDFTNEECNILNDLEAVFNDRSTSDLTIKNRNRSMIYVHKSILKIRCSYFRTLLGYIESTESIINRDIYVYAVYETFFKYLYTGKFDLASVHDLLDLLVLADDVGEKNLEMDCFPVIRKAITVSNVIDLFNLVNKVYEKMLPDKHKEVIEYCFPFFYCA